MDLLPDRFLTGPAIPGAVSHQTGDYRTTNLPPYRAVHTPQNANITLTGLLPTLRDYLSALTTGLPGIPEPPSPYMNSQ